MEFFILWLIMAVLAAGIASHKGRSVGGWFIIGLVFGIFAVIVVAVLSSNKPAAVFAEAEAPTPETHVRCPECRELVRMDARKCKHCGTTLVPQ